MSIWRKLVFITTLFLASNSSAHDTGEPHIEIHNVQQHPTVIVAEQEFEIRVSGYNVGRNDETPFRVPWDLSAVVEEDRIILSGLGPNCYSPHPPLPPNDRPQSRRYIIPGVPAGTYTIEFSIEQCSTAPVSGETTITVYPALEPLQMFHESPRAGTVVSGIGVIRGWACYHKSKGSAFPDYDGGHIGRVSYRVDEYPEVDIPYGSSRTDTSEICGTQNTLTGYGGVTYWGAYGTGEHTFTLYVDGEEVENFQFSVAAPATGFQKGLAGEYELSDFPGPGDRVRLEWSEADQNFIIVEFD